MADFTFLSFRKLLEGFRNSSYQIKPFENYINQTTEGKTLILRHDVDRFPAQTQKMARMEAEMGISGTYYFRIVPSVFKPDLIREVAELGHEIGYHYEELSLLKGDYKRAMEAFEKNLKALRTFYPVKTICMHGSPLSKWDNKKIWDAYDYRNYGIIADTSLDVDYNRVFYISDNGRAWNRTSVSVRDKVYSPFHIPIRNSDHLLELIQKGALPDQVMINAHPDTFFDFGVKYMLNWGFIEAKNVAKWFIVKTGMIK